MNYTVSFGDLNLKDVRMAGGKATSLAFMMQNGVPVPSGFVVTTDAFTEFSSGDISDVFKEELLNQFDELGFEYVAVRSSAIAEDAGDASWAGQLESFLNVTRNDLLTSIQKCWDSISSTYAVDYAKDKNEAEEDMRVAVVVQGMVQSEVSGVMFTADPVSRDKNKMLVEGVYGLGEMIVQGIVTPDLYVVSKNPFKVVDFSIQIKNEQMLYNGETNEVVKVAEAKADKSVLREQEVEELAKIGIQIEKLYGRPQDIEWAWQDDKFYIVQARPITTL